MRYPRKKYVSRCVRIWNFINLNIVEISFVLSIFLLFFLSLIDSLTE
jgi:hypothetical protein